MSTITTTMVRRIREMRAEGLFLHQIASALNISIPTVAKYQSDERVRREVLKERERSQRERKQRCQDRR